MQRVSSLPESDSFGKSNLGISIPTKCWREFHVSLFMVLGLAVVFERELYGLFLEQTIVLSVKGTVAWDFLVSFFSWINT